MLCASLIPSTVHLLNLVEFHVRCNFLAVISARGLKHWVPGYDYSSITMTNIKILFISSLGCVILCHVVVGVSVSRRPHPLKHNV